MSRQQSVRRKKELGMIKSLFAVRGLKCKTWNRISTFKSKEMEKIIGSKKIIPTRNKRTKEQAMRESPSPRKKGRERERDSPIVNG